MPQILTTNALVVCPHGGKGTTTPAHPKWQINNGYVAVDGDLGTLLCPFLPVPCGGYTLKSMGLNATEIDGQKVILVTDFNRTVTGLPLVMADFHQTFDESSPAPISPGQAPPPASPALADFASPKVVPPIQAVPFSISTTTVPVVINFTLASDHPLQWFLTMINEPQKKHTDLTNGLPGATVVPADGTWTTPTLPIILTMTPAFVAALTPGITHFYLTGVSQRGLSGHAEAIVTVTP